MFVAAGRSNVPDSDEILSVGRGAEVEFGILAETRSPIVITGMYANQGQPVRCELRSRWVDLYLVDRPIDVVRLAARAEIVIRTPPKFSMIVSSSGPRGISWRRMISLPLKIVPDLQTCDGGKSDSTRR